jgi:hypothetical protein
MVTIWINAKTYEAVAGHAPDPSLYHERSRAYAFTLERATLNRLRALREPFESTDDVIIRAAAKGKAATR